jgi:hypothetical protein
MTNLNLSSQDVQSSKPVTTDTIKRIFNQLIREYHKVKKDKRFSHALYSGTPNLTLFAVSVVTLLKWNMMITLRNSTCAIVIFMYGQKGLVWVMGILEERKSIVCLCRHGGSGT